MVVVGRWRGFVRLKPGPARLHGIPGSRELFTHQENEKPSLCPAAANPSSLSAGIASGTSSPLASQPPLLFSSGSRWQRENVH